ncbi:BACON domain-containing protein [Porphyromonas sp.]|uniref:BACON domain-containing protein n=1 Tax=Porphyromonas sp. TaxID=1924944 RepID=UPI0026DC2D4B|nr:BACON domain-containing protein [Porphyromonas sp.]MDO4770843.1 BACON domain-containing protein [Porphyromonas sp.]
MRKQFIAQLTIVATLLSILLFSCKKEEDVVLPVELRVAKQSLEFKSDDTEQTIEVSSNYEWEAKSDADWCKVKVEKKALTVSVDEYSNTEEDRYATVTIKSSNGKEIKTITVDISQAKQEPVSLILNPGKAILECEGLVPTTVELISTVGHVSFSWEGGKPEWMNEPVIEGSIMTLTAQDNPTKEKRTATLMVTVGKEGNQATEKLEIEQSPNAPYIKILPSNEIELDYRGTPVKIDVYWNTEYFDPDELLNGAWGYRMYNIEEITEQPSSLRSELLKTKKRSFKISADINPQTKERTQEVLLYAKMDQGKPNEISIFQKFRVIQVATPEAAFNISEKSLLFGKQGGEETVAVKPTIFNWEATCEASWITLEKTEKDELIVKAKPNTQGENKTATIKLSCGIPGNTATDEIKVTIAGRNTKITLSSEQVYLDAEGNEQIIKVLTDAKDWFVEGTPDWLTVKEDTAKGTLSLKASKAEATRTAALKVVAIIGNEKVEAALTVKQAKQYKLGDVYYIDGKAVGIVYHVYNNGSNGYVFSFEDNKLLDQGYDPTKMPCWSVGMYAGPRDQDADDAMKKMKPCCLDPNDGRNNLEAVKKRSAEDLRGKTWQQRYPALGWVEKFDQEKGNQGWYIPAKNELKTLVLYVNGIHEGSDIVLPQDRDSEDPENAKKRNQAIEKLNEIIRSHGGNIFYRDIGIDGATITAVTRMISSTEAGAQESGLGSVGVYLLKTVYPWWDQYQHASAVTEREEHDIELPIRCSIRPILRF